MHEIKPRNEVLEPPKSTTPRRERWFAASGLIGAVLASTCCIGPLVLVILGVSGAWIGSLTVLEPYKPFFAVTALTFIGLGFRQIYFRPKTDCADGSTCARPLSSLITKMALWIATVLTALALTVEWWAPLFY